MLTTPVPLKAVVPRGRVHAYTRAKPLTRTRPDTFWRQTERTVCGVGPMCTACDGSHDARACESVPVNRAVLRVRPWL
jgi:hypothetical protein